MLLGGAAADVAGAPPPTRASKALWGILASFRSCENWPWLSWYEMVLVLRAVLEGPLVFLAQAKFATLLGSSLPPSHWLQPVQRTSSFQCVLLAVVEGSTL